MPPTVPPPLPGLPVDAKGPVFGAPWEAQAFALALALHDKGLFTWPEWAAALSAAITAAQAAGDPDRGQTYYRHWLAALERSSLRRASRRRRRSRAIEGPGTTPPSALPTAPQLSCGPEIFAVEASWDEAWPTRGLQPTRHRQRSALRRTRANNLIGDDQGGERSACYSFSRNRLQIQPIKVMTRKG